MESNIVGILVTIIVYLGGMIAIGAVFSKKNKDVSDFYLGGRKLGPLVSAMSAEASDMSSWLLMGLPGLAYQLAVRCKASARLLAENKLDHDSGFLLRPLSR